MEKKLADDNAVARRVALEGSDVGKPRLDLDVRRTQDVTAPGLDIDSGERSNLSKVVPGQRPDQVLPDYFGLKLTAPTR